MFKKFIFIILLLSTILCQAQNFEWVNQYSAESVRNYKSVLDTQDNVYVMGDMFGETTFNYGKPDSYVLTPFSTTHNDFFISKTDVGGNLIWVKHFGGTGEDRCNAIAVNQNHEILFSGGTWGGTADYDPGENEYLIDFSGVNRTVIAKLDAAGNFAWAKTFGGTDSEIISIDFDTAGNIYLTGNFQGTNIDFDPGDGVATLSSPNNTGVFVLKLDSNGNYIWARAYTSFHGIGARAKVDAAGNVYVTGSFLGNVDFNPSPAQYFLYQEIRGTFITKLNTHGNFVWAKKFHTISGLSNSPNDLFLDPQGNIYIGGGNFGTMNVDTDGREYILGGEFEDNSTFMVKLNNEGSLIWGKSVPYYGEGFAIDHENNFYATGFFSGTKDFDPGENEYFLTASDTDIYLLKLDSNGNFEWAVKNGGDYGDRGYAIEVDNEKNVFATGYFYINALFNQNEENPIELNTPSSNNIEGYVLKYSQPELSIENIQNLNDFSVFPNPFTNKISIQSDTEWKNIRLFDASGKEIKNIKQTGNSLYTESLPKGIYFIQFELENRKHTHKLIVK